MTKTFFSDKGKIFKVNNIVCNEDDISTVTMLSLRKLYSDITKKRNRQKKKIAKTKLNLKRAMISEVSNHDNISVVTF